MIALARPSIRFIEIYEASVESTQIHIMCAYWAVVITVKRLPPIISFDPDMAMRHNDLSYGVSLVRVYHVPFRSHDALNARPLWIMRRPKTDDISSFHPDGWLPFFQKHNIHLASLMVGRGDCGRH